MSTNIPFVAENRDGERSVYLAEMEMSISYDDIRACAIAIVNDDRLSESGAFKMIISEETNPHDLSEVVYRCGGVPVFSVLPNSVDKRDMEMTSDRESLFREKTKTLLDILFSFARDGSYAIIRQNGTATESNRLWRMTKTAGSVTVQEGSLQWNK